MSEMIERAAIALYDASLRKRDSLNWQDAGWFTQDIKRREVRAVIEAMRKPTEAMAKFAAEECATIDLASDDDFQSHYADVWESMIDAVLSDQNPEPDVAEGVAEVNDAH